ncbi:MAG: hypothetical protein ACRCX2_29185 [Paraclostridium sp.]
MKNKTKEELILQLELVKEEIRFQMEQTEISNDMTLKALFSLKKEIEAEFIKRNELEERIAFFGFSFLIAMIMFVIFN